MPQHAIKLTKGSHATLQQLSHTTNATLRHLRCVAAHPSITHLTARMLCTNIPTWLLLQPLQASLREFFPLF